MKLLIGLVMIGCSSYAILVGKEHTAILSVVLATYFFIMDRLDDIERKIK